MIKYLIIILILLSANTIKAQLPSGFPTQANTGWTQWGYQQSTLGTIVAVRDTLWTPRFCGTMVLWPHAGVDTAYWMWDCSKWKKISTSSDIVAPAWGNITGTLSNQTDLQNALNLKFNISDTANKWVQNVYARNDSIYRFKNGVESLVTVITSTTLNNIGAGFRWAATPSGNVKTVFASNTILWDSTSNTNGLTPKVDTSVIATQYDLTQIPVSAMDVAVNLFKDTAFVPLIIISGESNPAGVAKNSCAAAGELDADPKVQIMQPSGQFEALNIGAGNNLSGVNTHGMELELQNLIPTVFNGRTVYLVKAGVGGSSIGQWQYGTANYDTLITRVNNAIARLRAMRLTPVIVWWYSQGINDGISGTDPDEWEGQTLALFQEFRRAYGYVPVIMTQLIGDRVTYPDLDALDAKIVDMAADKDLFIYRVQTPQGPIGATCADSIETGGIHWEYLGMKAIANRMTTVMMDTAGYLYYNYGIKNITNNAWNINGNRGTDAATHFVGTLDNSELIFRQNNTEAFRITTNQQIAVGKTTATRIMDINGDIMVNGLIVGRGGGNEASNAAFGSNALVNNTTGSVNMAVGGLALQQNTSGFGNVGIGYQAGNQNQTGNLNVFIGFQAGIGVTGGGNVLIGGQAGDAANYTNKYILSNSGSSNLLYGDFSLKRLVINPGSPPADNGVGTLQVVGKITVSSHDISVDSDSAIVWDRTTNEYKVGRINGSSVTTLYTGNSTLTSDRTVNTGGFTTTWTGSNDSETSFSVVNTGTTGANAISGSTTGATSIGVSGSSSAYIGVYGSSTTNNGVQGESSSGTGVIGISATGAAFRGQTNPSSNNAIENILTLLRTSSSGAGANNIGAAIQYELETATNGTSQIAGSIAYKWTDATNATRTSQLEIYGVNSSTTARKASLAGSGQWTWDGYGAGTFTGTPTFTLQTTSAGAIIEGPLIASGTYTPTLTNETNIASSTPFQCQYLRVGNTVTVSGKITIDYTATGNSSLGISLPIGSAIGNDYEVAGTMNAEVNNPGVIRGDATNDRAQFFINTSSSASYDYYFTFTYLLL